MYGCTASDMIGEAGAKEEKADNQRKKVVALHFIGRIAIAKHSDGSISFIQNVKLVMYVLLSRCTLLKRCSC